jgi:hypothetical protein
LTSFTFTLVLDGPPLTETDLEHLFEAGCDDAAFGMRGNVQIADFEREAPRFGTALLSSILDIESTVPSLRVVRVEPDDLVSAATIAKRTGRSRQSIAQLASGERGPGGFPVPTTWLDGSSQVWLWSEVADWFATAFETPVALGGGAPQFVAALNGVLEARRQLVALEAVAADEAAVPDLAFAEDTLGVLEKFVTEPADELRRQLVG